VPETEKKTDKQGEKQKRLQTTAKMEVTNSSKPTRRKEIQK
jgi:hypothetical protein